MLAHDYLIVDVDLKNSYDEFRLCKALYQFSWIKRVVKETKRGYHIYYPELPHSLELRVLFGDDLKRVEWDERNILLGSKCFINVAFKSTEVSTEVY
ncbi:MAG: hypothetical protein QXV17_10505 [Candidatus Micrarchaeaceae archaeon]